MGVITVDFYTAAAALRECLTCARCRVLSTPLKRPKPHGSYYAGSYITYWIEAAACRQTLSVSLMTKAQPAALIFIILNLL